MKKQTIEKIKEFLVVGVVLLAVLYSATNSWRNSEKLTNLTNDMKRVKESLIAMLLDENPNKTELARKLLASSALLDGLDKFSSKKYADAFLIWESAAKSGNEDSIFAIYAARQALRQKIMKLQESLPRAELESVLSEAPDVLVADGKYTLKEDRGT